MVYVALAQNVVILLLVWSLITRDREHARDKLNIIASNEAERATLLERIQRPEIPPHLHVPRRPTERDEAAEKAAEAAAAAYRRVGVAQPLQDVSARAAS